MLCGLGVVLVLCRVVSYRSIVRGFWSWLFGFGLGSYFRFGGGGLVWSFVEFAWIALLCFGLGYLGLTWITLLWR
ncbi:hypothetical protein F4861DRAFT_491946 [Xylaria intraflava]|nr:hypothetical protein F4861DRAFT_491946 [Xylaria intraflava]